MVSMSVMAKVSAVRALRWKVRARLCLRRKPELD